MFKITEVNFTCSVKRIYLFFVYVCMRERKRSFSPKTSFKNIPNADDKISARKFFRQLFYLRFNLANAVAQLWLGKHTKAAQSKIRKKISEEIETEAPLSFRSAEPLSIERLCEAILSDHRRGAQNAFTVADSSPRRWI